MLQYTYSYVKSNMMTSNTGSYSVAASYDGYGTSAARFISTTVYGMVYTMFHTKKIKNRRVPNRGKKLYRPRSRSKYIQDYIYLVTIFVTHPDFCPALVTPDHATLTCDPSDPSAVTSATCTVTCDSGYQVMTLPTIFLKIILRLNRYLVFPL